MTSPIKSYLFDRFKGGNISSHELSYVSGQAIIPPPLQSAFLRGEAILRTSFFACMEDQNIDDPISHIKLWASLVEDRQFIQDIVEKGKVLNHFKLSYVKDDTTALGELSYIAYCIVLFDAHSHNHELVVTAMTDVFVRHTLPMVYSGEGKLNDVAYLKRCIASELSSQWKVRPEIKESFVTDDDKVTFTLIAKGQGPCPR
ncbi:MAG: hypothetical protein COB46_13370 [Rhodospirillaceae bacterium]|nr:MAG: hypothetical protein COB46_13370 [Rhodospirillaceae bacterium]